MRRTLRMLAAAALVLSPVTGCSDGADKPDAVSGAPSGSGSASAAADVPELAISGIDFAFQVEGEPKAGLTKISFRNDGKEEHMTGFGRLRDGKTLADVQTALKSQDEAAFGGVFHEEEGDLDAPQVLSPGYAASTYVTLNAGTYALVCFIPSPDGTPHFAKGMLSEVTVAPADAAAEKAAAPTEAVELSFTGGKLTGPTTLPAGKTLFKVTTDANHELFGVVGLGGATAEEGLAYITSKFESEKPPTGPAKGAVVLQLHDFDPGQEVLVELDLPKGDVMFLCQLEGEGTPKHGEKLIITVT